MQDVISSISIACFEALFYSGYKPPKISAPQFISPPKAPCEDVLAQGLHVYIGSSLWF